MNIDEISMTIGWKSHYLKQYENSVDHTINMDFLLNIENFHIGVPCKLA